MTRPTDESIRAWALPSASNVPGSCQDGANDLHDDAWRLAPPPANRSTVRVYIDRGYAQDHWALRAFWEGDEEGLIIDNTIAQFGGKDLVFVGTQAEWMAELKALTRAASVVPDPGGALFRKAENDEREAEWAKASQNRVGQASGDGRLAATLSKKNHNKPRNRACCTIL